jgi:hypothetical protein
VAHESQRGTATEAQRGAFDASLLTTGLVFPTLAAWLYFVVYASSPTLPALYTACKIAQFLLPIVWLLLVARRRRGASHPSPRHSERGPMKYRGTLLAGGVASGALLAAIVLVFYMVVLRGGDLTAEAAVRIAARLEALHCATPIRYVALALYWRWFAFGRLRAYLGMGGAVALSSVAFAAHHVIALHTFTGSGHFWWATVLFSLAVAGAGALWAWQYARGDSLVPVWVSHTLVDLAIMATGYDLVWPLA